MNLQTLLAGIYAVHMFGNNSPIMQEAMKIAGEERQKKIVGRIAGYVSSFADHLQRQVKSVRDLRKQERELSAKIKKLDRALQFFHQEGNPLPFMKLMDDHANIRQFCLAADIEVPNDDSEAYKVPDSFNPPLPVQDV